MTINLSQYLRTGKRVNAIELFYAVIFVQELCKILIFYIGILNKKYNLKRIQSLSLIIFTILSVAADIYFFKTNYAVMIRFFVLITYIISFVAISQPLLYRILVFIPTYFAISIIDMGVFSILNLFYNSDHTLISQVSNVMVSNMITLFILFTISFILSKLKPKRSTLTWQNYVFAVTSIIISAFFIAYANFVLLQIDTKINRIMNMVFCMVWIILLFIVFLYINLSWKKETYRLKLENSEKFMKQQQKYYQMILDKNEDIQRFRHDYKNHLSVINGLLNEDRKQETIQYLQEIIDMTNTMHSYSTGNNMIDIIINDIVEKHRNKEIELQVKGSLIEKDHLSGYDICTIIYNAVENAFEAAEQVNDQERYVRVSFSNKNNRWLIEIRNCVCQTVDINENSIETTKADKSSHGIGIKNMKQSIEKNGGLLYMECQNKEFITRIML